jgi:acetoin utilization deacetylase AcuC-like enzyme
VKDEWSKAIYRRFIIMNIKKTGVLFDERYLKHNMGAFHPESPDRLRAIIQMLEKDDFIRNFERIEPVEATEEEIKYIHDSDYFEQIKETEGRSIPLDPDTFACPFSYRTAMLASGGVLSCVDAVLTGHVINAFAFVRPPGHHAEKDRAMGFCFFNNIAIAARHAQKKYGIKKVIIIDADLHHGNGTQNSFYSDSSVFYFSTHQYPCYPGSGHFSEIGEGEGTGFTLNVPLPARTGDREYEAVLEHVFLPVAVQYKPDLVLVSAGFDTYYNDPIGGMRVTEQGFGRMTEIIMEIAEKTCAGKLVYVLEGGYNLEGQANGCKEVLCRLSGLKTYSGAISDPAFLPQSARSAAEAMKKFWKINL